MLSFYRRNIKAIIWIIVLSFVAWGVGTFSVSTKDLSPYVGSVKGHKITQKEFTMTMRFYELLSGEKPEAGETAKREPLSPDQLRALAWQTVIVSREAKHEGISVSDEEIKTEIERLFSVDGSFRLFLYQDWVRRNFGGRPRDFEEIIRRHLAVQKTRQKILAGVPEDQQKTKWLEWLTNIIGSAELKDFATPAIEQPSEKNTPKTAN